MDEILKISCILPTKNRCQMVFEAINSIKRQEIPGLEIVVVDDGSTDNTMVKVKSKFPDILTVNLHGVGPGLARNAGVAASSGNILMFLDSDDIWLENHVRMLVDVLDRGYQVAYGVAHTRDDLSGTDFLIPESGLGTEGDCFNELLRWCFLVPSAMALKREAFDAVEGFNYTSCGEDWLFFLKLAVLFPFGFAGPEPITFRRLHRGSLCFLSDKKNLLAIISLVLIFLENEPRATSEQRNHFIMLHEWTAAHMDKWSTVQDWYLSLVKENLI
jgi:glycosyltransferase involved in cell wall biosynthesis